VKVLLAIRIVLFVAVSPLLMRIQLGRLNALVTRPLGTFDPERMDWTIRFTTWLTHFGRPFVYSRCVARGLTLYYFLRRLGVPVSLVFGAGQVSGRFAAHCWLERDHKPYLEKVDPRTYFASVYRFEGM
jgi:hypothetical protein